VNNKTPHNRTIHDLSGPRVHFAGRMAELVLELLVSQAYKLSHSTTSSFYNLTTKAWSTPRTSQGPDRLGNPTYMCEGATLTVALEFNEIRAFST
jgi:hypothetical protein